MDAKVFNSYYQRLNPAQRQAVDAIEGPVMVVAGPGTGKTQVLTLRIANILRQTDTPADAVLALTFTQSGVHAMRERLVQMVGSAGYRVHITTFHGFANEVIQRYPEEFPRIIGARAATRVEQIKVLEGVIEGAPLKLLRPYGAPYYHLPAALAAIDKLKKEGVTPQDLAKLAPTPREQELSVIYGAYQEAMRAANLYDFADMIMEVLKVLRENKPFRRQLQEEFLYFLADEHQDANQAQNELLALLASYHKNPNLFLVGDEKQAIFQFQGASLENFNYFKKLFPVAKLITLTQNYRSGQAILDAAQSLIEKTGLAREQTTPLQSAGKTQSVVRVAGLSDPQAEERFLMREISEKIKKNKVAPDEIAVIYRDNADALPIAEALEQAGIRVVVASDTDLLTDLTVGKIIALLEAIHHFGDEQYLWPFLYLDFVGLDNLELYRLSAERRELRANAYELLQKKKGKLKKIYQQLAAWQRLAHNVGVLDLLGTVLEESGFISHILRRRDAGDAIARVQAFYEEVRALARHQPGYRLANFIDHLYTLRRHHVGLPQTVLPVQGGVRLMTAHRAKGLEFDYVYIIGATDGHFGNRRRKSDFQLPERGAALARQVAERESDDERRLFYVALTRARREVTVTYARATADGRQQLPSQFIAELDSRLVTELDPAALDGESLARLKPRQAPEARVSDKAYIRKLFHERGLSATDINNYLKCPLQYFYVNLLGIVRIRNKHVFYGSAVHATLKEFFDAYKKGTLITEKKLLARLNYYLAQEPFSERDLVEAQEKGHVALGGYYRAYKSKWTKNIINEYYVRGVLADGIDIKLQGSIDKLEINNTGVCVVDYKTGKPKTRGHIMGHTRAEGSGDYWRQLLFYKLLLDAHDGKHFAVTHGMIDFIEPDAKGKFHQEAFELTAEAIEDLKKLIKKISNEITSARFLRLGCRQKDCQYCRLWGMRGE